MQVYSFIKDYKISSDDPEIDDEYLNEDLEYIYVDTIEELKLKRVENPDFFYYLIVTENGYIRAQSTYSKFDNHELLEKYEGLLIACLISAMTIAHADIDSGAKQHMAVRRHNLRSNRCQLKNNPDTYEPKIIVENERSDKWDVCIVYTFGKKFNYKSELLEYRIAETERDMKIDFINNFECPQYFNLYFLIDKEGNIFINEIHDSFNDRSKVTEEEAIEEFKDWFKIDN